MRNYILSILLAFSFAGLLTASTTILPTDVNIQYLGRFDKTNPLAFKMYWTASEIRFNFQGTSLKMQLSSWGATTYNLTIDGKTTVLPIASTSGNSQIISLATGLADGTHTASFFKRDAPWSPLTFYGLLLDDGKSLTTPPELKIRKMEFYGDSQTQGAQVEVPGLGGDLSVGNYDNNYYSFAGIAARALNADYTCVARNGATLVAASGKNDIPTVYDRTGIDNTSSLWDFNSWKGDVICINLGVNDNPFPSDFTARYIAFVQKIRVDHPDAYIFLLAGPLWNSDALKNAIKAAVTSLNTSGDSKVYYLAFTTSVNHSGHPRTVENVACAKELVTKIKTVIWSEAVPNLSVQDVYITPIPAEMVVGGKQQLVATVSPFDAPDKSVTWSSSNENVLTVSSTGLVTAVGSGTATITLTSNDGGKKYSCSIKAAEPIKTNLVVNPGFESALTTGWTSDWGNTRRNSTSFKSGAYSMEVSPAGGRSQTINGGFVAGETYTLSAWGKVLSGSPGSYIGVQCRDAANKNLQEFNSSIITSTTDYERKVVTFVIPENTASLTVLTYLFASGSVLSVDDFELIMGSKPTGLFTPTFCTNDFKLFPNPLKGNLLTISSIGLQGEKTVSIFDITGKLVFSQKLNPVDNQTINLSNYKLKGTYIAKLSCSGFQQSELLVVN